MTDTLSDFETADMGTSHRPLVIRLASLLALTVSAALLMTYLRPSSLLCGFDGDCDEVLFSRFGILLGVPLPVFGVLIFAGIFGLSLSPPRRRLLWGVALATGLGGLALILVQVGVLHRVCPLCLIVDTCALVIAWFAFGRDEAPPVPVGRLRSLWVAAAVAAVCLGAALGTAGSWLPSRQPPVPPEIRALWVPGKVTIVEIVDFECPHCRHMHSVLQQFLRDQEDHIHFVRIMAPMPKHAHTRDAARAYLCAEANGAGEAMADKLFEADDLSPQACERLAASLGLATKSYRACVADPETERRLDANLEWVATACPEGLPCIWVQDQKLTGLPTLAALHEAVIAAERRR
jgi:uncharacterized membrane protein/protein-disulfide isomerase